MNKADGTILSGGCMMGSNPCKEMLLQITKILEREMNMNIKNYLEIRLADGMHFKIGQSYVR